MTDPTYAGPSYPVLRFPRRTRTLITQALAGLALACVCIGCADVAAVAKFAAVARQACSGFSDIAMDFAASAERRATYVKEADRADVIAEAKKYKEQQPEMLAAQKVLENYIAALAQLAGGSNIALEGPITATDDSLRKIGMTAAQAKAGVGLAGKLSDAITAGYRSHELGKVIRESNAPLQEYLKGLEQVAGVDYENQLDLERISVDGFYNDALHRYEKTEPLTAILIRRQMEEDMDRIAARQKAAKAYVKILTDIGEAHQKLYDSGEHMSDKNLISILEPYAADIGTQGYNLVKAY